MTLHTQVLLTFRRNLAKKYFLAGCAIGTVCVVFIVLYIWIADQSGIKSMLSGMSGLFVILLLDIFQHRRNILRHLDPKYQNVVERFEAYQTRRFQKWEDGNLVRVILGAMLLITLLFLLFFAKESKWAFICASLFICFLLYCMLNSWMHFQDQITLHDIKRSTRDQAPDIST